MTAIARNGPSRPAPGFLKSIAEPPPKPPPPEPFAFSDLRASIARIGTERPWLVEGWIEGTPIAVWIAGEKAKKSWKAQYLSTCVATGTPLFGEYAVHRPGPVVVADSEYGDFEFGRRQVRICRGLGLDVSDVLPHVHHFDAGDLTLDASNEAGQWFITKCEALRPSLIVLDPWRNLLDGDENDAAVVRAAMKLVAQIRDRCGAAVLIPHHLNRAGTFSGSRALLGRADLIVEGTDEDPAWYKARGRTVRHDDPIARRFTISITHDHDDDDTRAATRFGIRFDGEAVAKSQLTKSSLRVLDHLRENRRPTTKNAIRKATQMNGVVVDRALHELQDAGQADERDGKWSLATPAFFGSMGGGK